MTDSELREAIRGLYRIQRLGYLDELRRWIAAAVREYPIPANPKHDHRYLAVSLFAHDVAQVLGVDRERVERAAMAIYIPSYEQIVLEEIRRMLAWLSGQGDGEETPDEMMVALAAETGFQTAADFEVQRDAACSPPVERLRIVMED